MSEIRHSLRLKLALNFAVFGAVVSLMLSLGLSYVTYDLGERLIDETLSAEIDDYIARRIRNPEALPPTTANIRGYMLDLTQKPRKSRIPPELQAYGPGMYQLVMDDTPYRLAVVDQNKTRYFMLFNEVHHRNREESFVLALVVSTLIMTLVSAGIGWLLAGWIVAPVAELSRRVHEAQPEDEMIDVAEGFSPDEIGELAHVFDTYLKRMRAFTERERNFTADVSHELRTPLAIAQGAVEIMENDSQLTEKQRERVARFGRATREMINLTEALLLMAREGRRYSGATMKHCDVCEVVAEAIEQHRHLLSSQAQVQFDCRDHPQIAAERTLLGIVVANLVRNAFNHTPSGSVTLTVTANFLTVTDTGRGIGAEEIGRVFLRHFKGAGSKGSGIGLSLVKRICDSYGWDVVIDSIQGQGTKVQLVFAGSSQKILN